MNLQGEGDPLRIDWGALGSKKIEGALGSEIARVGADHTPL